MESWTLETLADNNYYYTVKKKSFFPQMPNVILGLFQSNVIASWVIAL